MCIFTFKRGSGGWGEDRLKVCQNNVFEYQLWEERIQRRTGYLTVAHDIRVEEEEGKPEIRDNGGEWDCCNLPPVISMQHSLVISADSF